MTFDDLPPGWNHRPLTTPDIVTNLLELLVSPEDRTGGAAHLLMCDRQDRLVQPVAIDGVPPHTDAQDCERLLRPFVDAMSQSGLGGSLLVALARPVDARITENDRRWRDEADRICTAAGIRLLGLHVVTLDGPQEVPAGEPAV